MADPLGSVEKIVKLAGLIKDALETVRRNKEECREIANLVARISAILGHLKEASVEKVSHPAMSGPLEDLAETLDRSLTLVTSCQERHVVCRFFTAGDTAKQLRRVKEDMCLKIILAAFSVGAQGTLILQGIQSNLQRLQAPRLNSDDEEDDVKGKNYRHAPPLLFTCFSFTKFSLSQLETATHNFSEDNLIGQGSFTTVYKGILHDGLAVAIKKIQYPYQRSMEHIYDRLSHVSKLEHKNIVQLLGYGYAADYENYIFLVEENMPHGSMDNIIYGSQFDWSSRLQLIQGIAHGLHYLHEQRFVHLDLKPSNVLVDSDVNPKITDFGRAKMLVKGDDVASHDTDYLLAGTMGYMPPEYIIEGIVSTMYDVYSFGVILLETISGMCRSEPARHQASIEWAWVAREVGRMEELLDPSLCSESQLKEVRRCMEVGMLCTQSGRADRPTMLDVVEMLDNKKELPTPRQPKYTKVPRNSNFMVHE